MRAFKKPARMTIRTLAILVIVSTNFIIILLSILAGTGYVRRNIENYIETDMMVVADIADRFISAELNLLRHEAEEVATSLAEGEPSSWAMTLAAKTRQYPTSARDGNGKVRLRFPYRR